MHQERAAEHRPRLHRLDRHLGVDTAREHAAQREGRRRPENEQFRDDTARQQVTRVEISEDGDTDQAEQETDDARRVQAFFRQEPAGEPGRQHGREADDDGGGSTVDIRVRLTDKEERVVGCDEEDGADGDECPLSSAAWQGVVEDDDGVGEHDDARDVVADGRKEYRRNPGEQASLDGHERRSPERGEHGEQQDVPITGHVDARRGGSLKVSFSVTATMG